MSGPVGEVPYFERALADAMHHATYGLEPAPLATDDLHRQARVWRRTSAAVVAVSTVGVVAAAAVLVDASVLLRPEPARELAGPGRIQASGHAEPTADTSAVSVSAGSPPTGPPSASEPPTGGSTAETAVTTGPPAAVTTDAAPRDRRRDGDQRRQGQPAGSACQAVPDGSAEVRRLVLDITWERLRPWWDELPEAAGWPADAPDSMLERWVDVDAVVDEVERFAVVECEDGLRLADPQDGDLRDIVQREVDEELARTLPDVEAPDPPPDPELEEEG